MEDDDKKPEAEPEPAKDDAKPEPAKPEPATDEAKPEPANADAMPASVKEPPPPPIVHPPPGPPPPQSIRILKSVGTVAATAAILGGVALIAQYLGRDPAPQETPEPVDTSHVDDQPPPPSTTATLFGLDDVDASAPFLREDDTTDAATQPKAWMRYDGGHPGGHGTREGGTE